MDDADDALLDEQISGLASRNIVSKPSRCPTDSKLFEDWRFDLENFMSVVHSDYGQEMNDALSTNLAEGEDLGHGEAGSGIRKKIYIIIWCAGWAYQRTHQADGEENPKQQKRVFSMAHVG